MTLESRELSERTGKCNTPHSCLCFSIKLIHFICNVQNAHLYVLVKEFPTFHSDFPKALCGGFVSETTPSVFPFLSVQGTVQAFATRRPIRTIILKLRLKYYLRCVIGIHISIQPAIQPYQVNQSVSQSVSQQGNKKESNKNK